MKTEDLIEGLNRFIEQQRGLSYIITSGHIVLQKKNETNPNFKVYKTYIYTLWFVQNRHRYELFSISENFKVMQENKNECEDKIYQIMDIELSKKLFEFIHSNKKLENIINGDYGR